MGSAAAVFLAVLALAAGSSAYMDACVLPAEGSTGAPEINLNYLASSKDYMVPSLDQPTVYTFDMNICTETKRSEKNCPEGTMVCELLSGTGQAAYLYNLNLEVQRTQQGAKISGVGARCPTSGNYETTILFICKEQGAKEKPVNTVLDAANCKATFEFETVVACGGKPPAKKKAKSLDVGMLLCLLFFIPFIIYFAAGAGLMYRQGRRGTEMVPNNTFWFALPGLIKDGFKFTFSKLRGGSGSYEQL